MTLGSVDMALDSQRQPKLLLVRQRPHVIQKLRQKRSTLIASSVFAFAIVWLATDNRVIRWYRFTLGDMAGQANQDLSDAVASGTMVSVMNRPGLENPELGFIGATRMAGETQVIGVVVGESALAFAKPAMLSEHVVNLVVDGTSFSVSYCNISNCVRVLQGSGNEPPQVATGGADSSHQLMLLYEGKRYAMDSREIPLADLPHVECTLEEWQNQHSESLIFEGSALR